MSGGWLKSGRVIWVRKIVMLRCPSAHKKSAKSE